MSATFAAVQTAELLKNDRTHGVSPMDRRPISRAMGGRAESPN